MRLHTVTLDSNGEVLGHDTNRVAHDQVFAVVKQQD